MLPARSTVLMASSWFFAGGVAAQEPSPPPANTAAARPAEASAAARAPAAATTTSAATSATTAGAAEAALVVERAPVLPHAITSFGACRSGGWLYVFGGHIGREHAHSRANVVGAFQRLNLADGSSWQALAEGPALQGTALAAAPDGRLYRVGGLSARNAPGDDPDLHSTASVARFDPATGTWSEVTPLPEPRSSHDAIVIGHQLFVVGGWHLHGDRDGTWLDTAWVADLGREPLEWQPLPAPDQRRACALAALGERLVVLGGMDDDGPIATVRVLDPALGGWRDGPALPGMAFGTAALGVGTRVLATTMDGRLFGWDGAGDWQVVAQLATPRFFHRLVAAAEPGRVLALGGAGRGGHMRSIETIDLQPRPAPVIQEHVIPAPGRVVHRQALLLRDNTLWAFGGNRGGSGDRFAAEQFADDIWKIDLLALTASRVGALPSGRQSMAATTWGDGLDNLVLGGLGRSADAGAAVRSLTETFRWDRKRGELRPFAPLPRPRTQFAVAHHGGKLWVLGGTDFVPDADGGSTSGDACEVLVCDLAADTPAFAVAEHRLPRPRRSFGAAVLGDTLLLIGGLGDGFAAAGPVDVLDFATGRWSELAPPVPWVSPQVAVIGERVYVACGGTMDGQKFIEDRSLWSWHARDGWQRVVEALPFPVRHVQMLALRNRLLFHAANDPRGDRIVVRTLEPDRDVHVLEANAHR